jgi:hypothetical protein
MPIIPDDDEPIPHDPSDLAGRHSGEQGILPYVLMGWKAAASDVKPGRCGASKNIEYRTARFRRRNIRASIGEEKVPQNRITMMEGCSGSDADARARQRWEELH